MRERLLWDRFLVHWLPPEEVGGDVDANIDRAFSRTYYTDNGKQARFNNMGAAFAVITADRTVVAADVPPLGNLPAWLALHTKKEARELRRDTQKRLVGNMVPHFWLEFGRTYHTANSPVLGGGSQIVISRPAEVTTIDLMRIDRARRAIKVLGSKKRALDAAKLLNRRMQAQNTNSIDVELRKLVRKSQLSLPAFFDAAEATIDISRYEWELAT